MSHAVVKSFLFSTVGILFRIALVSDVFILPALGASTFIFDHKFEPLPDAPLIQPEISSSDVIVHFTNEALITNHIMGSSVHVTAMNDDVNMQSNPFFRVAVPEGKTPESFLEELRDNPHVLSAEPNIVRRITRTSDDPRFPEQWHLVDALSGIQAPSAWDIQTGSADVVVAVVDSGVDIHHPDLEENIWNNENEIPGNDLDDDKNGYVDDVHGYDFFADNGDPSPSPDGVDNDEYAGADTGVTHGTHVAGIIGAVGNNGVGISGVAWNVSIMAVQVLDDEGAGLDTSIAAGIQYAADNGADIINMSLGGFGSTDILEEAVRYAQSKGVLIIAASGNNGVSIARNPFYPVCYDGVLGVASTGQNNASSSFSNYGSECVDVSAPGDTILSTLYSNDEKHNFTDDYGVLSGTSMAAPVVSGIAALLAAEDPALSRQSIAEVIMFNATDVKLSSAYGVGRVDAAQALQRTQVSGTPPAPARIRAFRNVAQKEEYTKKERTADENPYFTWQASTDPDGIEGYYVYFGNDPNANPVTAGTFQSERSFQATNVHGDERAYYLRVVAKDTAGLTSFDVQTFSYIVDTRVSAVTVSSARSGNVDDGIAIQWGRVRREHVQKYVVRRAEKTSHGMRNSIKLAVVPSNAYRIVDHSAQRDVQYRYRVGVVDDLGNDRHTQRSSFIVRTIPQERVVIGAGDGAEPRVQIMNAMNANIEQSWLAFGKTEKFGVDVAVGDCSDRAQDEIVAALGEGSAPRVKVFHSDGSLVTSFLAYEDFFRGGVRVAVGDVNNDGRDEIITVPGRGRAPEVKVFEPDGRLIYSFLALDEKFQGGLFVATARATGNGAADIVVSAGPSGGPQIMRYDGKNGRALTSFFAYDATMTNGVSIARFENGRKQRDEIVTIPLDGTSVVKRFGEDDDGTFKQTVIGFIVASAGRIASGDIFQKGNDRLLIVGEINEHSYLFLYDKNGRALGQMEPFGDGKSMAGIAAGWVY